MILILVATITTPIVLYFKRRLSRVSYGIDSYIEIGPLAPTRMDIPEDVEEFGVHKVTVSDEHENGNIYEVAQ